MRKILIALCALALLAPLPALAESRATARASGDVPLRAGPGAFYGIVGRLADGTRVHLERCTVTQNWCLVLVEGEPAGWARGSYLVGSPAKLEVTPHRFLGFNPLDPLP